MYLEVRAGQDNPIYNYLQTYYVDFKSIAMNAYTSPETGIRMDVLHLRSGTGYDADRYHPRRRCTKIRSDYSIAPK